MAYTTKIIFPRLAPGGENRRTPEEEMAWQNMRYLVVERIRRRAAGEPRPRLNAQQLLMKRRFTGEPIPYVVIGRPDDESPPSEQQLERLRRWQQR